MGLVNDSVEVGRTTRMSDVLFEKSPRTFASLAALPSNVEAIEAALLFTAGLHRFVAVVGPSGWGKSHLLEAVACRLTQETDDATESRPAGDYLAGPGQRLDISGPLVLDDVQDVLAKARSKQTLRLALERRVRANRPTILAFTQLKPSRQLKSFLPSGREWVVATVEAPCADERVLLLNQLATAEGLALAPGLIKIIARQMHGNGRTLAGALKRLRLASATWLDKNSTLRACGLLDPFFADNSAWDLKMKILRVAEGSRAQFSRVAALDLALYVMLHIASLGEADVARAADIAPAEAYLRANRFAKQLADCETTRRYVAQFVETVVASLADE